MTRSPVTPQVILGPFYPVSKPPGVGASLLGPDRQAWRAHLDIVLANG